MRDDAPTTRGVIAQSMCRECGVMPGQLHAQLCPSVLRAAELGGIGVLARELERLESMLGKLESYTRRIEAAADRVERAVERSSSRVIDVPALEAPPALPSSTRRGSKR